MKRVWRFHAARGAGGCVLFCLPALFALWISCPVWAATFTAASCSHTDVQAVVATAADGDTVQIPAGTCTWTETVTFGEVTNWHTSPVTITSKAITIQGAGIGRTIIKDGVAKAANTTRGSVLGMLTKQGGLTRVTGITFDRSDTSAYSGNADPYTVPVLSIGGYSQSLRVDHCRFIVAGGLAITIGGWIYGVLDHNLIDLTGWHPGVYLYHSNWNGKEYGDGSWADAFYAGSGKAVYLEDNVFNSDSASAAIDTYNGARAVLRYNTLNNTSIANHGTDSSGRGRGGRSMEIYENAITLNDSPTRYYYAGQLRSGTFIIFNNKITNNYPGIFNLVNYRDFDEFAPWGKCDGTSPFDLNDGKTHDAGSHTGTNASTTLTAAGKTWAPDQWAGYYLHNTTKKLSALITANTADTITTSRMTHHSPVLTWDSGDVFEILRATVCLDQRGRGAGDLLSGWDPLPKAWPRQALEPTYAWGNTLNGGTEHTKLVTENPWRMKEGRDFFNTPMPGYTPYVYPHPLVSGSAPPAAPKNLRLQP